MDGDLRVPHDASHDSAIGGDGGHHFPFGLIDFQGVFLQRMRQEVERAAGEVNGNIAVVEEHRPESGRSAISGGSGNVRKSEACNLHLGNEDAVLGRHSLYATSTHG